MRSFFRALGELFYNLFAAGVIFGAGWMLHAAYIHQNPLRCLGW